MVAEPAAIPDALVGPFAKACAVYAAELLTVLVAKGFALASLGIQSEPEQQSTDNSLASAPEWVREAYARTKALAEAGALVGSDEPLIRARIIRDQIAMAMKHQGLTQAALAKRLKTSQSVVSRIFRNPERSRLTTLRRIADALKVDLTDLLDVRR